MSSRRLAHALVLGAAVALSSATLRADEAEDRFRAAAEADRRMEFRQALDDYRKALELRPSGAFALRARVRAEDLASHSEGDFAPLARLETVRRDPRKASDPAELASLFEAAKSFPEGRVKQEALLLVAEGFGRRLHDPAHAAPAAELLVADGAADRVRRAEAAAILVDAYTAMGDEDRARKVAREQAAVAPLLAKKFVVADRRRAMKLAAGAVVGIVVALGVASFGRLAASGAWRRMRIALATPWAYAVAAILAGGGAFFAWLYDPSVSTRPFWLLGAGTLLVDRSIALASAAFARGRVAFVVAGAFGIVSAAVLALVASDPSFLEGFGL